jgi:hypothetical protein
LVTLQVKNVGSSIVRVTQEGTCIKINPLRSDAESSEVESFERENTQVFPVLRRYLVADEDTIVDKVDEVEPGAAINEQQLFLVSADPTRKFEVELRVEVIRGAWWIPGRLVPRERKDKPVWMPDRWIVSRKFSAVAIPVEASSTAAK